MTGRRASFWCFALCGLLGASCARPREDTVTKDPFDASMSMPDAAPAGAVTFENDIGAGFGNKIGWMAICSASPSDVIARLDIRDARRTLWRQGIDAAYGGHRTGVVYVTPPIDGWVIVVGT